LEIKPLYTLAEVAAMERCKPATLRNRIVNERLKLPIEERRYPGYSQGVIPLRDVKARFDLTTDELRELDLFPTPTPAAV
jgi:hypothetical protein